MRTSFGTIVGLDVTAGFATLTLRVGRELLQLHGEGDMTLSALAAIFQPAPPPAPPMSLIGKRVRYSRDGALLTSLGPA